MTIFCRFAPSPTGFLHVGNIRAAIINYLFAKKLGGRFMLRLDDTDASRVKEEYRQAIVEDMAWLGLTYDEMVSQRDRLDRYEEARQLLLDSGRLYECYESDAELKLQRKAQIAAGMRPLYDRGALNLTDEQKADLRAQGLKPHYRFLLKDQKIAWDDKIKGRIEYDGLHFSDPVLVREGGVPTYTFCSVADDLDYGITDVIRGEDHITNTVIQIQIFEALKEAGFKGEIPNFAHLALVKAREGKISKREGGFDVRSLRKDGIEAQSLRLLLAQVGTSGAVEVLKNIDDLVAKFDFGAFGRAATQYDLDEVRVVNQKLLAVLDFEEIAARLQELFGDRVDARKWQIFRPNIEILADLEGWLRICEAGFVYENDDEDKEFLQQAASVLPENVADEGCWGDWVAEIKKISDRKGKKLFLPLRLALTGQKSGPELKDMLGLIGREEILRRLGL